MTIKAIETKYNGCFFRSRLEARWAVWFDAMKIKWVYEQQGWDIDGERYLPDFRLPEDDVFVEIKPTDISDQDQQRVERLIRKFENNNESLWLIQGLPADGKYKAYIGGEHQAYVLFAPCRRCDGLCYISYCAEDGVNGWGDVMNHTCGDHDKWPVLDDRRLLQAYDTAMRKKFEHLHD